MFKAPFSFEGRIRRTEYGLSIIIQAIALTFVQLFVVAMIVGSSSSYSSPDNSNGLALLFFIFWIPSLWFLWAQGAKRCHDVGNSGWWQLIPLYGLWLIFEEGQAGQNKYGDDPKNRLSNNIPNFSSSQQQQTNTSGGYQGGYSGGHNNPNSSNSYNQNQSNSGEYQSGNLYR
jgi:uncharacterized membrane protein YhaH (DUF805 family)